MRLRALKAQFKSRAVAIAKRYKFSVNISTKPDGQSGERSHDWQIPAMDRVVVSQGEEWLYG
jgi:hypothetical protein